MAMTLGSSSLFDVVESLREEFILGSTFCQVAPVLLTQSLLERMRNNFMIVEVWDKKTSSENDQVCRLWNLPSKVLIPKRT